MDCKRRGWKGRTIAWHVYGWLCDRGIDPLLPFDQWFMSHFKSCAAFTRVLSKFRAASLAKSNVTVRAGELHVGQIFALTSSGGPIYKHLVQYLEDAAKADSDFVETLARPGDFSCHMGLLLYGLIVQVDGFKGDGMLVLLSKPGLAGVVKLSQIGELDLFVFKLMDSVVAGTLQINSISLGKTGLVKEPKKFYFWPQCVSDDQKKRAEAAKARKLAAKDAERKEGEDEDAEGEEDEYEEDSDSCSDEEDEREPRSDRRKRGPRAAGSFASRSNRARGSGQPAGAGPAAGAPRAPAAAGQSGKGPAPATAGQSGKGPAPAAAGQPGQEPVQPPRAQRDEPAYMALVREYHSLPEAGKQGFLRHTGLAPKVLALPAELSNNRMDWRICATQKLAQLELDLTGFERFPFAKIDDPPHYFWKKRASEGVDKVLGGFETDIIKTLGDGWLYWIFFRRVIRYIRSNKPFRTKGLKASVCADQVVCKLLDDMFDVVILMKEFGDSYVASAGLYWLGEKNWSFMPFEKTSFFCGNEIKPEIKSAYIDMLAKLQSQKWPLSAARHLAFRAVCRRVPAFCDDMKRLAVQPEYVHRDAICNLKALWFRRLNLELDRTNRPMPAIAAAKGLYVHYPLPFAQEPEAFSSEDELYADAPQPAA